MRVEIENKVAPVAQLDRASDFGSEGWGFESLQARIGKLTAVGELFVFTGRLKMPKYDYHIFVCENVRDKSDPRGSCGEKGGKNIRALLKKRIAELGLKSRVRANSAGCLNACGNGPSIVIYPQGVWYGRVTEDDVEEILQKHIIQGKVVQRLLAPGQDHLQDKT